MIHCQIPDCGNLAKKRGWCMLHYARWHRHGDPLAGGTPKGEPEHYLREVVLAYDGDDCLTWPYGRISTGYGNVWLDGRTRLVSRIVCEHAHGPAPSPKHDAAHSCGNGHEACCTKRHLSWKTRAGNMADKLAHGTHGRGERAANAKLTESNVVAIRALCGRVSQRAIAEQFGISQATVSEIHGRKKWAWLAGQGVA